jgi:hypothetical protein
MANKSRQEELIDRLHANGLRKRVATAITGGRGGRRKGEKRAREVLRQLEAASDTIRDEVLGRATKRSEAAKKAARTRKRNADKRSAAAKKGAAKKTGKSGASRTRAKAASKR